MSSLTKTLLLSFALFILGALPWANAQQSAATGTLTGTVGSAGTGNFLQGARVEIRELGRVTLTDATGRYVFYDLPTGTYEVSAYYLNVDTQSLSLNLVAGGNTLNFQLSSEAYQLEKLTVQTVVEGNALALTTQRNAANVKNVVALDAYGNLPNMSAGELAIRLPGVAPRLDDEGNASGLIVRGAGAEMTRVNVDGELLAPPLGMTRRFHTHSITGAIFEQLEVIKAATPDMSPDSLGGSVNMKTRSPLNMQEKRRFSYNMGARWAPPFYPHSQLRRNAPIHPMMNFAYQEVFDVSGGERNLGISLNLFHSQNVNAASQVQYDYQNTLSTPAYIWNYRTSNRINNREQTSLSLKTEYRFSQTTKLKINTIYNDAFEEDDRLYDTMASSSQTIATIDPITGLPIDNGAIMPDYSSSFTETRPVTGSNFLISTVNRTFRNRTRLISFGVEHELTRLKIDYDAGYNQAHVHQGDEPGGNLTMVVPSVGFTLDTTDPKHPKFSQTAGSSIYDIRNYDNRVTLQTRNHVENMEVKHLKGNALYQFNTAIPFSIKTGILLRVHEIDVDPTHRRWNYLNTAPPMLASFGNVFSFGGTRLPHVDPFDAYKNTSDATLWSEDIYFNLSERYATTRRVKEEITAGYIQTEIIYNKLRIVGGVRKEKTKIEGFGYMRQANASAADIPDPIDRANFNWNHPTVNRGNYAKAFPSIHFTYDVTERLRAQASWSTSFARPDFGNFTPATTVAEGSQSITIGNPSLGPQNAKNIDIALQYYLRPAGIVAVSYFEKDITDYIQIVQIDTIGIGLDNGFNGSYVGYSLLTSSNAGSAKVRGVEIDYRQQLSFLPRPLNGVGLSANYTYLTSEGDFGGGVIRKNKDVAGFVPQTANAGITYSYSKIGFNALMSYNSDSLQQDAVAQIRRVYRKSRTTFNFGAYYEWKPSVRFFVDLTNAFNKPQEYYMGREDRLQRITYNGQTITFGVSGRF